LIGNNIHSTALRVEHLSLGYGDRTLVRDISFELAPGEVVLLAGPNGCGKTTLLKCLASEGIILIPTNIPKVKGFTVEGFIETGCYRESDWKGRIPNDVRGKMVEAMELLGIQELKNRDISTLSDGEFQKACLATGLTRKAEVLLLDEPTAHLDVENRIDVLRTLRKVARKTGTAILFSSHDLHDALQVADRVFALTRDGRFLCSSVIPSEVKESNQAVLRAAFPNLEAL
jgi:iron complex transport system ATP-binding protein